MEFAPQDNTTFSDAILEHADFSRTCLQELDFTRAQLKGAVFAGANIDRTNLDQSDLECATFCCSFLKNARNLDKVKNAQRMDIGNSAITNDKTDKSVEPEPTGLVTRNAQASRILSPA